LNLKNSINLAAGKKSKISKLLIITNPVKGGFYGYSNNFRGFIPKSQIHLFIKDSYSRLFPLIKKLKGVKIKKHYYRLLIKKNFYIRLKSSLNTVKSFIVNKKLNQGR
jgi:ribosomal protein S1